MEAFAFRTFGFGGQVTWRQGSSNHWWPGFPIRHLGIQEALEDAEGFPKPPDVKCYS